MTALHSVPLDVDHAPADLCTSGDEVCDIANACSVCEAVICPEHCDDFVTCVATADVVHCGDCRLECPDCEAAYAQDHAEGLL
jgi:hypothetical protein